MTALKLIQDDEPAVPHSPPSAVELISSVSLFIDIKDVDGGVAAFAKYMKRVEFGEGETIITQGEKGDRMFILLKGSASVYCQTPDGEKFKVAILKGEDRPFFGEGGLLDQDGRTATIVADEDCMTLTITRDSFDEFGKEFPQLAFPILKRASRAVMKRLSKQSGDMLLLYNALINHIRGSN